MEGIKEKIIALCKKQNISLHKLEMTLGFGNGTIRKWDKFTPNMEKLQKVADYFHVTTDYFSDTEKPDSITFDDFTYAMHNESKELTEENKQKLLELARFFKEQQTKEQ